MTKLISVELKEEGNKLYAQKNYSEAYQKYTAAIAEDTKNPVLYANRAACSMGQKMYTLARDDAQKVAIKDVPLKLEVAAATYLDPGYPRAWARLAAAQDALARLEGGATSSIANWRKALDALPKSELGAAGRKQKAEYEAGLLDA
ncbi:hypothetical protein FIBSPDRAFT_890151 [Athelia psychrophila]|uniref:TPR-like protein n=1 Tax=Athelia psychrophila TaxID=1759441 RepID=A0A166LC87_9AGAM|nr:hypothetical protein FIBSPDRAFT_890151 [Fibularhizoctonia sp. CBS 109695]